MNSRLLDAAALGLALVASFTAADASAYCRMTTEGGAQVAGEDCVEKGEPLVWTNPCLSYAVDSRGSRWFDSVPEIESLVDLSFSAWEDVDCGGEPPNLIFKPLQASTCKRAEFNEPGANVNTIAFLDPWKAPCADEDDPGYPPLAFAVTIVWHRKDTGEILDADMMINDLLVTSLGAGGPYADCPDAGCPGNNADLRSIVTHEAGHFIGIGHCEPIDINDPNDPCVVATMYSSTERASVGKRTLAADDIQAVCDIYPPGDLDLSCDATPVGGLQLNCETTASGDPISCEEPVPASGCSVTSMAQSPTDTWALFLAGLLGFTVMRRRSARRVVQS